MQFEATITVEADSAEEAVAKIEAAGLKAVDGVTEVEEDESEEPEEPEKPE